MTPPLLRAVVLRTRPYSETSLWVRLYSESHGKITGIAKGARKGKDRIFAALLEVELKAYPPRSADGGLWKLARPEIISDWRALAADSVRMPYAFSVLETCDRLLHEAEPHPELFDTVQCALATMYRSDPQQAAGVVIWYLIKVADALGYSLQYQVCPRCQNPLVFPVGPLQAESGGILCRSCAPQKQGKLARTVWEPLVALADAPRPPALVLAGEVFSALLNLCLGYLSYHAERPVHLASLDLLRDP